LGRPERLLVKLAGYRSALTARPGRLLLNYELQ